MMRRASSTARLRRRGFSLIELLLAIFILGIGLISIAALFPVGIVQQQQSVDDVIGPTVANNAMSMLRSRLKQRDFGAYEQFDDAGYGTVTVEGDWPWARPIHQVPGGGSLGVAPAGSIRIFRATPPTSVEPDFVPYNRVFYGDEPPAVIIPRGERAYPMYAGASSDEQKLAPRYFWECMFRRFQGRVQVAIFVYRVSPLPGERSVYTIAADPSGPGNPPLPIDLVLFDPETGAVMNQDVCAEGPWDAHNPIWASANDEPPAIIEGTADADLYDPYDAGQAWQEPRQWILDQNGNVHRVLGRFDEEGISKVELVRPVEPLPPLPVHTTGGDSYNDIVTRLWYLPLMDGDGRIITPVYMVVEEL